MREHEAELARLERSIQERTGQIEVLRERLAGLESDHGRRHELIEQLQVELAANRAQLAEWEARRGDLRGRWKMRSARLQAAEEEIQAARRDVESKEEALQAARTQALASFEDVAQAQSEMQRTQQALASWRSELERRRGELAQATERLAQAAAQRASSRRNPRTDPQRIRT